LPPDGGGACHPGRQTACAVEARGAPLYALGPKLRAVELLLPAAAAEPGWLLPSRFDAGAYGALAAAAQRVVSRCVWF
jgi:hypothetical protein